jgi:hypothetical protein
MIELLALFVGYLFCSLFVVHFLTRRPFKQ